MSSLLLEDEKLKETITAETDPKIVEENAAPPEPKEEL